MLPTVQAMRLAALILCVLELAHAQEPDPDPQPHSGGGLVPKWPNGTSPPVNPDPDDNFTEVGMLVQTTNGPVRGKKRGLLRKTLAWWGIPFAEPPVGELRLRAPQPLKRTWTEPLDAFKLGASCEKSEDCLYLNVYSPASGQGKPVMYWIYGGGFVSGDGSEMGLYDGQHLAETHDVVVVTVNYRIGNLGFMALDALKQEDPDGSTGNYGVQDQRLGLKWVQNNIAGFGGDPGRVTIFGESAGGMSVMYQLVSPASAGLFHAAIMESGTSSITYFFQPYADATKFHEEGAAILDCPRSLGAAAQLKCLRALPMDKILHGAGAKMDGKPTKPADHSPIYPIMPVGPVIDGTEVGLLDVPIRLIEAGRFNKVPLIAGSNEDGGTIFEPMLPQCVPDTKWPATLHPESVEKSYDYMFHENASKVAAIYNVTKEYKTAHFPEDAMLSRMVRDLIFMCPLRAVHNAWAKHGIPSFMYVFHFDYGFLIDNVIHLGDFHAGELPFVFKNWLWVIDVAATPLVDPQLMSNIMSCKWTSFAYNHDPNGDSDETKWPPGCATINRKYNDWPQYDVTERKYYGIKNVPVVRNIMSDNFYPDDLYPRDEKCDMWDEMAPYLKFAHDGTQRLSGDVTINV